MKTEMEVQEEEEKKQQEFRAGCRRCNETGRWTHTSSLVGEGGVRLAAQAPVCPLRCSKFWSQFFISSHGYCTEPIMNLSITCLCRMTSQSSLLRKEVVLPSHESERSAHYVVCRPSPVFLLNQLGSDTLDEHCISAPMSLSRAHFLFCGGCKSGLSRLFRSLFAGTFYSYPLPQKS